MTEFDSWEKEHLENQQLYLRQITEIYDSALIEVAAIGATIANFNPNKPFSFSDYPITHKRVEKLLSGLKNNIEAVILNGINVEWTLSNNKNSELANWVFGDNVKKLSKAQQQRYYNTHDKARKAFQLRKEDGLNLSDRVWRYTEEFKEEIEFGLDCGLRDGLSADDMTKELRSYLRNTDKLFRRVRDEHDVLQLSKAAKAYHPGQGVYRSSYKNAHRLAATEANIAFRTADYLRWQDFDFVVGIEIKLSNNHTLNGKPFTDICDTLVGKYPKDFKFTGWHPYCRCYAVPILKSAEEMEADNELLLQGKEPINSSHNKVSSPPKAFGDWLTDNSERIAVSGYKGTTPYFLLDNDKYVHLKTFKLTKQQKMLVDSRSEYLGFPTSKWERVTYAKDNGGFLVVDKSRIAYSKSNKQERAKFVKEKEMAEAFARSGHRVQMLPEVSGVSSPDVLIDNIAADLKRSASHNNIVSYAKKAINKQGAEMVLFQFDVMTPDIHRELNKIKALGIAYKYFITDGDKVFSP